MPARFRAVKVVDMSIAELVPAGRVRARTTVDVDIVIPVYNEEEQLAASITRCAPIWTPPSPSPPASPSPTTPAPTTPGGSPPAWPATQPGVDAIHLGQKGRGRALRAAWSRSSAVGRRLHGRRPGHRPRRTAAAGGPAALGPQRPGHRHPAGARRPRGPGRPPRVHLPGLQPAAAIRACAARAPTPSAGSRRCAGTRPLELLPLVEDDDWFFDTECW